MSTIEANWSAERLVIYTGSCEGRTARDLAQSFRKQASAKILERLADEQFSSGMVNGLGGG